MDPQTWTELLWDRASNLNQPSNPVDGMSDKGMVTQPKKSSCELCLADWQTCLKNLPRPRTPRTSFNLLTASNTELSSSWSQMSKWRESLFMSSMSLKQKQKKDYKCHFFWRCHDQWQKKAKLLTVFYKSWCKFLVQTWKTDVVIRGNESIRTSPPWRPWRRFWRQ